MTSEEAQELMDKAWDLAVKKAKSEYNIYPDKDGDYSNSDHQVINDIQSEIYEELGGDLEEYYELCGA
jgi:hypothetical protein